MTETLEPDGLVTIRIRGSGEVHLGFISEEDGDTVTLCGLVHEDSQSEAAPYPGLPRGVTCEKCLKKIASPRS